MNAYHSYQGLRCPREAFMDFRKVDILSSYDTEIHLGWHILNGLRAPKTDFLGRPLFCYITP